MLAAPAVVVPTTLPPARVGVEWFTSFIVRVTPFGRERVSSPMLACVLNPPFPLMDVDAHPARIRAKRIVMNCFMFDAVALELLGFDP